jgi:hypothetical protein
MGGGSFDYSSYRTFASSTVGKTTDEIYSSRSINKNLDPKGVKLRESRDSVDNPESTPIIIALDVTGSMGMIADVIAREGLGVLFNNILDRKPVTDPHLMFMGIGDANCDSAPLQVSQFEADNRIVEQLTQLFLEHGGGGNNFESYNLPWYFAGNHTVHDSYEKRAKRGYLFTVGDEEAPLALTKKQIETFIGDIPEKDISPSEALEAAQRLYDVFHIIVLEGSHAKSHKAAVVDSWTNILGQRVIQLSDHTKLAETIVSAIEVAEGVKATDSASRWTGVTATVVHDAVKNLTASRTPKMIGA